MRARPSASLSVRHLSHRYPGATNDALIDVGFEVRPGQRLGLLGPNGAGKSTLMRLLCGYLPVRADPRTSIEVAGFDVRTASQKVRSRVGYMPEQVPLYHELRAREHLRFRAKIKGVPRKQRDAEIDRVAALTGIGDVLHTPIGQLSRGYRQRVGLSDALLGAPPLVILDEPTVGLDPNQVRDVRAMLRALGGAQTLVFSSHILAEVEMLCDAVVILSHGRVVVDEPIEQATTATHVHAEILGDARTARRVIEAGFRELGSGTGAIDLAERDGVTFGKLGLATEAGDSLDATRLLAAIGSACVRAGVTPRRLAPGTTRLEERFAEVTGAARTDPPQTADRPAASREAADG